MNMHTDYERMLSRTDGHGWLKPDYRSMCLSNLPGYVAGMLKGRGGVLPEALNARRGVKNILLVIADGMGLLNVRNRLDDLPFLRRMTDEGKIAPMTSVFPSTTGAAMTSIFTGTEPVTHALLEWFLFLDEAGMIIETLPFRAQNPAEQAQFQNLDIHIRTLFEGEPATENLAREGIECTAYLPENIVDSGFSVATHGSAARKGYHTLDGIISELVPAKKRSTFTTLYYPEVDAAGHTYGPSSPEYLEEMRRVDGFLSELSVEMDEDTVILLTADHGQIDVNPDETLYLDDLDWFDGMLAPKNGGGNIPPYGSPRDVIIRAKDAAVMCSRLNDRLGEFGVAKTSEWLTGEGYFGNGARSAKFETRAGSVWFLPHSGKTAWYRHYDGEHLAFKGVHGGMTPQEILVPLAVI